MSEDEIGELADELVNIVGEYEGLGVIQAELIKREFIDKITEWLGKI